MVSSNDGGGGGASKMHRGWAGAGVPIVRAHTHTHTPLTQCHPCARQRWLIAKQGSDRPTMPKPLGHVGEQHKTITSGTTPSQHAREEPL